VKKTQSYAWKVSCKLDYTSTPWELFHHSLAAESKEELPKTSSKRVNLVRVTREKLALERLNPLTDDSFLLCFESEEELESYQPINVYPTKTNPEITGVAYFQAKMEVAYPHGCGAGALLFFSNHLTRVLVLGEELTEDFETSSITDAVEAQKWVKENLVVT